MKEFEGVPGNSQPDESDQTFSTERRIIVNHEQVDRVLGRLVLAYSQNEFPYYLDKARVPHDHRHMPTNLEFDTTEHAMFLWTVCYYMRGGVKSVDALNLLANMHEQIPEAFVAKEAKDMNPEAIAKILEYNGLGFQKTVSELWVENASRMHKRWDGDPRNIFSGVSDYEETVKRILNDHKGGGFIGFQHKMVSMITYYLMDEGLIDYYDFPLPVDIHVLRITVANEMIYREGVRTGANILDQELLATMRKLYYDYAVKNNLDVLRLCDAVWLLSQVLCGKHPGNITTEPEGRKNRKGRHTILVPYPVDPDDEGQRKNYHNTCARCPIEDTCHLNVPGKPYYVHGGLRTRGERVRHPEPRQHKVVTVEEKSLSSSSSGQPNKYTDELSRTMRIIKRPAFRAGKSRFTPESQIKLFDQED